MLGEGTLGLVRDKKKFCGLLEGAWDGEASKMTSSCHSLGLSHVRRASIDCSKADTFQESQFLQLLLLSLLKNLTSSRLRDKRRKTTKREISESKKKKKADTS